MSLTLYMFDWIDFVSWTLNTDQTQVKFIKSSLSLYMCSCIGFYLKFDFSQTQVKLKTMSLTLYMCSCNGFLIEYWTLVKLKPNSRNWVWLCTCVLGLIFTWKLNFSQTQVKLSKEMSLILYMRSYICYWVNIVI